ncbi:MAG: LytTR family transcriptional regulator [Lewinellaceae bacterium]|nr:LytTR family transcriptional regulator [Lewinellaceae bacterium]
MLHLESDVSKVQISTKNQLIAAALVIVLLFTGLSFYWWRSYRLASLREQMLNEQHQALRRANEALVQSIETPSTAQQNGDHLLNQTITFPTRDHLTLRLGDILYVKSLGGGVTYFTGKGKFHVWQTLNQSREFLPESLFVQVHRSYIVNLKQIVGRTRQHLTLSNKIKVPVGALYRDTLEG